MKVFQQIISSYRIEARSNPQRYGKRRFGYTNIWAVALNIGVAEDAETQAMRRKVLVRLAVDGFWFTEMYQFAPLKRAQRQIVLEEILRMTERT